MAPDETPAQIALTWDVVVAAGNRCQSDIALIEATTLLTPQEQKSLTNDALEVFYAVFQSYIQR